MSNTYPFFPWSDDEADSQPQAELGQTSASNFADEAESDQTIVSDNNFLDPVPLEYNWESVLKTGIQVATPGFRKTCLEIVQHSSDVFNSFRDSFGGATCVFKFGITCDPVRRMEFYKRDGYQRMIVILMSAKVCGVEMLEAFLISKYGHIMGCRNVALGGEGNLGRFPPPFFVYIVGARADRPVRVA